MTDQLGRDTSRSPSDLQPVLCIRHQPSAPLGIAEAVFEERGVPFVYLDAWRAQEVPPIQRFSGLMVLGGEMHAHKMDEYPFLRPVRDLMRVAVDQEVPTFGICLGGQILAAAMGADVGASAVREIGFHPLTATEAGHNDDILSTYASDALVFQFHQDTFGLPDGAELLFSTPAVPHQAFRIGDHAYAVQFHPEVTKKEIMSWAELEGGDEVLAARWGVTMGELLAQADRHLAESQQTGRVAFGRFLDLVEATKSS